MSDHTTPDSSPKLCECGCGQPTAISNRNYPSKGHVKGQPVRFIPGHHIRLRPLRPVAERFWEKVDVRGPNECWLWLGSVNPHGYGQFNYEGKCWTASRFAYFLTHGSIADGMDVCHNCPSGDNPACCNPTHLWEGTQTDNTHDMHTKGRGSRPPVHRGKGGNSTAGKHTNDQARQWRKEFSVSGMSMAAFARLHGVTDETMRRILKHKTYQDA